MAAFNGIDVQAGLERTTLAKVSRRLLPLLFILYIVCLLDRVHIGFAALQMNHDLGFSPAASPVLASGMPRTATVGAVR